MNQPIIIKTPHVTTQGSIVENVRYTPQAITFGIDETGAQVVQVQGVISHPDQTIRRLPRHVLNPTLTFDRSDVRLAKVFAALEAALAELASTGLKDQRLEIETPAAPAT